jgi:hypothetical protein
MDSRLPFNFEIEHLNDAVKIRLFPNKMSGGHLVSSGISFLFLTLFLVLSPALSLKFAMEIYQNGALNLTAIFFSLLFLAGFLILALNGVLLVYLFIWQLTGIENLEIQNSILKSQKTMFGKEQVKEYKREQITDILLGEVTTVPHSLLTQISWMLSGKLMGQIIIRLSDGKTDYLGLGLFREQAVELIEIIRESLFTKPA